MNNFSDRFVVHSGNPIHDITEYLVLNAGFTLGVLPTGFTKLRYAPEKILAPTNLIGGIGEGITGYFFVNYLLKEFIVKTVGKVQGCNGIIVDRRTQEYGLIEVKTTLSQKEEAQEEAIKASAELLRESFAAKMFFSAPGFALSVGVSLMEPFTVNYIEFRFV
ncbi:MAG: hypothetical protein ACFE9L_08805 [Candidatus Hodarchaeota archaeon]